jgi:hypothetical protein
MHFGKSTGIWKSWGKAKRMSRWQLVHVVIAVSRGSMISSSNMEDSVAFEIILARDLKQSIAWD